LFVILLTGPNHVAVDAFCRPSPKLVLIILQLCRVALPLMSTGDCAQVVLPTWGQHLYAAHWSSAQPVSDPPARIISLLLAKLGDLLVPGKTLVWKTSFISKACRLAGLYH
jgi:hypothetical protein